MLKAPPHIACEDDTIKCSAANTAVYFGLGVWALGLVIGVTAAFTCAKNESRRDRIKCVIYGVLTPFVISYWMLSWCCSKEGEKACNAFESCCCAATEKAGEITKDVIELGGAALRSEYERMPKTNGNFDKDLRDQIDGDDISREAQKMYRR
jgi:hypothetical protein